MGSPWWVGGWLLERRGAELIDQIWLYAVQVKLDVKE